MTCAVLHCKPQHRNTNSHLFSQKASSHIAAFVYSRFGSSLFSTLLVSPIRTPSQSSIPVPRSFAYTACRTTTTTSTSRAARGLYYLPDSLIQKNICVVFFFLFIYFSFVRCFSGAQSVSFRPFKSEHINGLSSHCGAHMVFNISSLS